MSCTLMDSRCEDWRNTRDGNYYLYQKGSSQKKTLLLCIKIIKIIFRKLPIYAIVCYLIGDTTEHCYCENKNGKNKKGSTNGIMCKTPTGSARRIAYCGSDETCTGPTSSDECSLWPLGTNKADLCTPPSMLDQVLSGVFGAFPFGK